jgi:hypothetical protein
MVLYALTYDNCWCSHMPCSYRCWLTPHGKKSQLILVWWWLWFDGVMPWLGLLSNREGSWSRSIFNCAMCCTRIISSPGNNTVRRYTKRCEPCRSKHFTYHLLIISWAMLSGSLFVGSVGLRQVETSESDWPDPACSAMVRPLGEE